MSHKCHNSGDSKDLEHPRYQYGYHEVYQQHVIRVSKDRASIEAFEDQTPCIPCNVPPEDMLLDDAAREDTMTEDAPLATSHDLSLLLP
jgi:hypothetical protein